MRSQREKKPLVKMSNNLKTSQYILIASIEEVGFIKNNESKDPKGFRRLIFQILVAFS